MFGLLEPNPDKFNNQEKDRYKSVYCGLCHSLRKNYNNVSRFCLTFDLTFLIVLLSAIYEPEETKDHCRCVFNKGKKTSYTENEFSIYAADLTVMFAYEKLLDDICDEGKLKHKVSRVALENQYKKVQSKLPEICETTKQAMEEIRNLEAASVDSSANQVGDEIAKIFGYIMAIIFSYKSKEYKDTLAKFGANLGRAIYYLDAAIDLEDDIKEKRFNPYLLMYKDQINWLAEDQDINDSYCKNAKEDKNDESDAGNIQNSKDRSDFYEKIKNQILVLLGLATEQLETIPIKKDKVLIENILFEGIWSRFNYKLHKSENKVK